MTCLGPVRAAFHLRLSVIANAERTVILFGGVINGV
jgi:hypothetical protein